MNYSQFMDKKDDLEPVYLISGDSFLVQEIINTIQNRLNILDSTSIDVFDGENFNARSVINACEQLSFFDDKRIIIVKNVNYNIPETDKNLFLSYLKNPNKSTILLIIDNSEKKVFGFLPATKILCEGLTEKEIAKIVKQFAKKYDVDIEERAIQLLSLYTQNSLQTIKTETEKLCFYKFKEKLITEQDVKDMVSSQDEIIVYELTNSLSLKQTDKAITILKKLMGTVDQNAKLFNLIVSNFKRMFIASISKQSDLEVAQILGVKEYAIKKTRQQAKNFTVKKLKNICETLSVLDYYSKSGAMTLENALYYICFYIVYAK